MSVRNRQVTHGNGDGDDLHCRAAKSETTCSSPMTVDNDSYPVVNFPSLSKHEVDPISDEDMPTGRLLQYSPDRITMDCLAVSDVLCVAEDTTFYVDDRRFSERLASFCGDSFDNDENVLPARMTERGQSAPHHSNGTIFESTVDQQWPTTVVCQAAIKSLPGGTDGHVNKVDVKDNLDDEEPVLMTASSGVYQSREQPKLTTYAELPLADARNQMSVVDASSFYQSFNTISRSLSTHSEPVEESLPLCPIEHTDGKDDTTVILSEFKEYKNTVQENCTSEETRVDTDTHLDEFGESKSSFDPSLNTSLCGLSNHMDKMDVDEKWPNEDCVSSYDNNEIDEDIVKMNGCSHHLRSVVQSDNSASEYEIFDSSTSIYDRIDKYNGVANRRRQISCARELPKHGLQKPSCHVAKPPCDDRVQLDLQSTVSEKRSHNLQVGSTAHLLSSDLTTNQSHTSCLDRTPEVTECPMSNVGSFPHFKSMDGDRNFVIEVLPIRTLNGENCTAENRNNGVERDVIVGANSNCEQNNEVTTAASATLSSMDRSLKDSVIIGNDSSTFITSNVNCTTNSISMDVDCEVQSHCSASPQTIDKQKQLAPKDASDTAHGAKTPPQHCLPERRSELNSVSANGSCEENSRRSGDRTTQLTTANISSEDVSSGPRLSGLMLSDIDNHSQRPSSATARSSSFIMVDINIDDSRPSLPSAVSNEHRHRLEAMKKQLLNAKPVAPPPSSIDSVWNSRIAGKLTPSARSRSSLWTPYDAIFFEKTATRPSATNDRMWRTTSLQTLPRKFTSTELCHRSSGSTIDVVSKNEDSSITESSGQAEMSSDKSRSLSDLRRMPSDEPRLQVYDIGSVDSGLDTENKIASSSSSATATSLRPLPSEEFIRRSLERLNLPAWFLNSSSSSLLRPRFVGSEHKRVNGSMPSCFTTAVEKRKMIDPQTEAVSHLAHPSSTLHVASSLVTSSDGLTSVSNCESSKIPSTATADQLDTLESLRVHPEIERHESEHRKSVNRATKSVHSSTEIKPTAEVLPADRQNREERQRRHATKTDGNERYRCPHGKKNSKNCPQCRRAVLDTALSPTRCRAELDERVTKRSPSESAVETTPVWSSRAFPPPAVCTDAGDNNLTPEQSAVNHKRERGGGTVTRRKSGAQHNRQTHAENDATDVTVTADCYVTGNRSLHCQEVVTAVGGTVDDNRQDISSTVPPLPQEREAPDVPADRRSLRLRKVKSRTRSYDVGMCRDVSERNPTESSHDKLSMDSSRGNASCEDGGSSYSRNRTLENVTVVAANTSDPLEIDRARSVHDSPTEISSQDVTEEAGRRKERKVRRRRWRQDQSNSVNTSSQTTTEHAKNEMLTANGDQPVIELDCLLTQRSHECDHNYVKSTYPAVESSQILRERDDGGQRKAVTGAHVDGEEARRRRRRAADKPTSSEAPPGECLQNEQKCQDRPAADLDERLTLPAQRCRRRRLRNDLSSEVDAELQSQKTDGPPSTTDSEHTSILHNHFNLLQNKHSASVLARRSPDSMQQYSGSERNTKQFLEGSYLTLTEGNSRPTSTYQPDDAALSTSRRLQKHCRRRYFAVTGSDSSPAGLPTPEVINTQSQIEQDGTQPESTSYRSESSSAEQKPCLSAAARRCRRVNKSQRSRSLHELI